ncbi:hypothetical protein DT87_32130 [Streptomyces sp. NTK 937]|nr:hypothetical protein DT87_32130 [Streptomyces sp. NTK 937]
MLTLCGSARWSPQSAPYRWIVSARSSRKASPVRLYSQKTLSSPSPQRRAIQLVSKAPRPWAFMYRKNPLRNGTIRVSPVYSCQERRAWTSGRNGQKSGPPFSDVRSGSGPKKPSGRWVARIASIQRRVAARAVASPVTIARSAYPRSQ